MKAFSMFAGVGGFCQALHTLGHQVVLANDVCKYAKTTYIDNIPDVPYLVKDINDINYDSLPEFDILTAGFPCQSFSLAGKRKGFGDSRGALFFNIVDVLKVKLPKYVLLENVKNLLTINNGKEFSIIQHELSSLGYSVYHKVLGSHTHSNTPQCRERLFIVGIKDGNGFNFPQPINLTTTVLDLIDADRQDDKYYYTPTSQYYEMFDSSMEHISTNKVYQLRRIYVRENKNQLCPTLTANMGGGGHNVPLIRDDFGIRKLTPIECFRFQGFPNDWKITVSNTRAYKQAGNTVTVPLVLRIFQEMFKNGD